MPTKKIEEKKKPEPLGELKDELDNDIDVLEDAIEEAFELDEGEEVLTFNEKMKIVKDAIVAAIKEHRTRVVHSVDDSEIDFTALVKNKNTVDDMMDALDNYDANFSESAKCSVKSLADRHLPELKMIELQTLDQETKFDHFMTTVIYPHYNDQQAYLNL
jgi:hypothetical protein